LNVYADFLYADDPDRIEQLHVAVSLDGDTIFEAASDNVHLSAIADVMTLPELASHTEQGNYQSRSRDRDARNYFGPEWAFNTWTPSFQDHLLWYMQRYIREGGLSGIYHDQYYPNAVHNTITGAAWELPDGRVNRGYNGIGRQYGCRCMISG